MAEVTNNSSSQAQENQPWYRRWYDKAADAVSDLLPADSQPVPAQIQASYAAAQAVSPLVTASRSENQENWLNRAARYALSSGVGQKVAGLGREYFPSITQKAEAYAGLPASDAVVAGGAHLAGSDVATDQAVEAASEVSAQNVYSSARDDAYEPGLTIHRMMDEGRVQTFVDGGDAFGAAEEYYKRRGDVVRVVSAKSQEREAPTARQPKKEHVKPAVAQAPALQVSVADTHSDSTVVAPSVASAEVVDPAAAVVPVPSVVQVPAQVIVAQTTQASGVAQPEQTASLSSVQATAAPAAPVVRTLVSQSDGQLIVNRQGRGNAGGVLIIEEGPSLGVLSGLAADAVVVNADTSGSSGSFPSAPKARPIVVVDARSDARVAGSTVIQNSGVDQKAGQVATLSAQDDDNKAPGWGAGLIQAGRQDVRRAAGAPTQASLGTASNSGNQDSARLSGERATQASVRPQSPSGDGGSGSTSVTIDNAELEIVAGAANAQLDGVGGNTDAGSGDQNDNPNSTLENVIAMRGIDEVAEEAGLADVVADVDLSSIRAQGPSVFVG